VSCKRIVRNCERICVKVCLNDVNCKKFVHEPVSGLCQVKVLRCCQPVATVGSHPLRDVACRSYSNSDLPSRSIRPSATERERSWLFVPFMAPDPEIQISLLDEPSLRPPSSGVLSCGDWCLPVLFAAFFLFGPNRSGWVYRRS